MTIAEKEHLIGVVQQWGFLHLRMNVPRWQAEALLDMLAPMKAQSVREVPEEIAVREIGGLERERGWLLRSLWMDLLAKRMVPLTLPTITEERRGSDRYGMDFKRRVLTCEVRVRQVEEEHGQAREEGSGKEAPAETADVEEGV